MLNIPTAAERKAEVAEWNRLMYVTRTQEEQIRHEQKLIIEQIFRNVKFHVHFWIQVDFKDFRAPLDPILREELEAFGYKVIDTGPFTHNIEYNIPVNDY
jgi:hypothetical protein